MIDLRVHGSPPQCRDAAAALRRWAESFTEASRDLRRAVHISEDGWRGDAGEQFRSAVSTLRVDASTAAADVRRAADGLDAFAGALEGVQQTMRVVGARALDADLLVVGDAVRQPLPSIDHSPEYHTARLVSYERLLAEADEARARERLAHERLRLLADGLRSSLAALLERSAVHPPDHLDALGDALWAAKLGAAAAGGAAAWLTKGHYGRLVSPGRHAASRAAPHVVGMRAARPRNWHARPGHSVMHARWARVGTTSGIAGGVISGGTSALDQWAEDSDRRDLSTEERYLRAGVQGGSTGLGAWGGTWVGVQAGTGVGAAVGSVFPGPGTAVGGVVGGVVGGLSGGLAGSTVGERLGDLVADKFA